MSFFEIRSSAAAMESANSNSSSFDANLVQDDANSSTFGTKCKRLIFFFLPLILFIAVLIIIGGLLIIFATHNHNVSESDLKYNIIPITLEEFCSAVSYHHSIKSCFKIFNPIIKTTKSHTITNPHQIFKISLQVSMAELQDLILSLSNSGQSSASRNCLSSLHNASSQINGTLWFFDSGVNDRWDEMKRLTVAANKDLGSCLRESTAVGELKKKVQRIKMLVSYSEDFLFSYDNYMKELSDDASFSSDVMKFLVLDNMFGLFIGGSELFLMLFILWSLFGKQRM